MARTVPAQKRHRSKQDYQTPKEFLTALKLRLGIKFFAHDFAADAKNTVAAAYFDKKRDALSVADWAAYIPVGEVGWLNPEFANISPWAAQCAKTGETRNIALLVPAAVGSNWWRDHVHGKGLALLLNGRITFVGEADPYIKDCALVLYGPDIEPGYEVWTWPKETAVTAATRRMLRKHYNSLSRLSDIEENVNSQDAHTESTWCGACHGGGGQHQLDCIYGGRPNL